MDRNQHLEQNVPKSTQTQAYSVAQGTAVEEVKVGHDGLTELFLMGVVSLAGFYALYKKSSLYLDRRSRPRAGIWKKLAPSSCSKCRFFDRDSTKKCRLHPVKDNEQRETNCTDYWQKDSRKFLHR